MPAGVPKTKYKASGHKALWDYLGGAYTLKGKDSIEIDFMCVKMIDPATSWFEIVEHLLAEFNSAIIMKKRAISILAHIINLKKPIFTSAAQVGILVNKISFSRYPRCQKITYDNGCEFNSILKLYASQTVSSLCQPASRTLRQMQYWRGCIN